MNTFCILMTHCYNHDKTLIAQCKYARETFTRFIWTSFPLNTVKRMGLGDYQKTCY